ncbi:hypothetical protein N7509_006623 [Penicillium cosmopolitanum]|uniref:HTH APSES-type domain-containing protein n=1 Tax=Penicillium cosmopolitanum TaxID=1131564 RepID=A0A9X0B7Q3_9EURO|nr:uncharacterized protein N7509_006623 [Penicillium cosmopolitanum]KAJ5391133.1 hypothetical protein N7509_006623 [Penicillium cosmopolitanum]
MASIKSLLNPAPKFPVHTPPGFGARYTFPNISMARSLHPGRHKIPVKYKIPKDAPIFKPNDPQGEIRYPPCEDRPDPIAEEHRRLELFPMEPDANIGKYPRTIPYRSEKKSFEEKTGRSKFEVYQYTFRYGDSGESWIMMWDYNIGLVRITHLFKALGYTKTTPAKALAQNPGLRDICHSITGGAIAAQGYWMPFEAARALAARFCYPIRYALTPMFGTEFPSMCLEKGHENFGNMVLDQSVIERATRTAHYYRSLEISGDALAGTESTSTCASSSASSASPVWRAEMPICPPALLDEDRSRAYKLPRRNYADSIASTHGSSSEPYCMSPSSPGPGPGPNCFTPVNVPRSHASSHISPTEAFLSRAASSSLGSDLKSLQGHSYADSELDMAVSSASQERYSPQAPKFSPVNKRINRMIEKSSAAGKYDDSDTDGTSDSVEIDSVDDEQDEDWRELESPSSIGSGAVSDTEKPKRSPPALCKCQSEDHPFPACFEAFRTGGQGCACFDSFAYAGGHGR